MHIFSPLFPLLIHPKETMRKTVKLKLTFSWKTLMSGLLLVCFRLPPNRLCCAVRRNWMPHPMTEMAGCQTVADKIQTTFTAKLFPWFLGCSFPLLSVQVSYIHRQKVAPLSVKAARCYNSGCERMANVNIHLTRVSVCTRHWKCRPQIWPEDNKSMGLTIPSNLKTSQSFILFDIMPPKYEPTKNNLT